LYDDVVTVPHTSVDDTAWPIKSDTVVTVPVESDTEFVKGFPVGYPFVSYAPVSVYLYVTVRAAAVPYAGKLMPVARPRQKADTFYPTLARLPIFFSSRRMGMPDPMVIFN
jgi:hypothetical protein